MSLTPRVYGQVSNSCFFAFWAGAFCRDDEPKEPNVAELRNILYRLHEDPLHDSRHIPALWEGSWGELWSWRFRVTATFAFSRGLSAGD